MPVEQALLDSLWDFSDAAGSEARLRDAAEAASPSDRGELLTQVARAMGLQQRFARADAVLDGVGGDDPAIDVRIALERGRLRNSEGRADAAAPLFRDAAAAAASAGLFFLQVDALHMLAIADPEHADEWTDAALAALEDVDEPRTLRWRVSLYNNLGWWHADSGRPEEALAAFEASRDAAERWGTPQQVAWADEAIAEVRGDAGDL